MSKITSKTIVEMKDFGNDTIPLCWNKANSPQSERTEFIDQGIFQSGPQGEMIHEISRAIDMARSVVCVSTFVIQQSELTDALLRASERGVRVYMITASDNQLEKEAEEMSDFDKRVIPEHKALLKSFAGSILVRSADHFHSKFILIDPTSEDKEGYLLSANLTQGALYGDNKLDGESLGTNFELGIRLTNEQIQDVFQQFQFGFWNEAKHELFEKEKLAGVGKAPYQVELKAGSVLWTVGKQRTLKQEILNLIDGAESNLVLSAWSFDDDHEVSEKIAEKAAEGVNITILTRNRKMDILKRLKELNASIHGHERLHGKFVIADGSRGIMMTANFTSLGLDSGFETGIHLTPEQVQFILFVSKEWIKCCRWSLEKNLLVSDIHSEILQWEGDALVQKIIQNQYIDEVEMAASSMENFVEPTFTSPAPPTNELYREAKYSVVMHPPVLPKKAKPLTAETLSRKQKKDEDLVEAIDNYPMYSHQGTIYFVVKDDSELSDILPLAKANRWSVVVQK